MTVLKSISCGIVISYSFHASGVKMDTGKEKLVLNQNLAAVRIENDRLDDESVGVATVIPMGEIIEIDRGAPSIGPIAAGSVERFAIRRIPGRFMRPRAQIDISSLRQSRHRRDTWRQDLSRRGYFAF